MPSWSEAVPQAQEVMADTVGAFQRKLADIVLAGLLLHGVFQIAQLTLTIVLQKAMGEVVGGLVLLPIALVLGLVHFVVIAPIANGTIAHLVLNEMLDRRPTIAGSLSAAIGKFMDLLTSQLMVIVFVILGLLQVVVPGLKRAFSCLTVPAIVMGEGHSGMNACERADDLMTGYRKAMVFAMVGVTVVVVVISLMLSFLGGGWIGGILHAVLSSVVYAFAGTLAVCFYLRARKEKEGQSVAQLDAQIPR